MNKWFNNTITCKEWREDISVYRIIPLGYLTFNDDDDNNTYKV